MKQITKGKERRNTIYQIIISAMLCAIGIIIPIASPIKLVLEPASYTLASHVPIFLAMFLSPASGILVAIGTSIGFLLGPFSLTVALRAASHVIFVAVGAFFIQIKPQIIESKFTTFIFSLCLGVIHAICEMIVVASFLTPEQTNVIRLVFGLVGIGTVIHSTIDFYISLYIWKVLKKHIKR